jgi:hypothetical protein
MERKNFGSDALAVVEQSNCDAESTPIFRRKPKCRRQNLHWIEY